MTDATTHWALLGLFVSCAAAACASPPAPAASAGRARPPAPPAAAPAPLLAPLTERERQLSEELRRDVVWLATEVGERNIEREVSLATAADELAFRLEAAGHAVERQGVVSGGDVVTQNLEVVIPGGKLGSEHIVVGAHYDTHAGTPGADDNASGVAAVLALARAFRGVKALRTLRIALFCNEELPHFQTASMGSLAYAKKLRDDHAEVVLMMSLESLAYYSDEAGSQRYPEALAARHPTVGNFLAIVGADAQRETLEKVTRAVEAHASLPVVGDALAPGLPGVGASDHWAFWQVGFPAVMITDTAPFRNPHYHQATDVPDTLDFQRFARAVAAVEQALRGLIGEQTT